MTSILNMLDSTKQTLAAQQFALAVSQRNIANVNNNAYTRMEIVFTDSVRAGDWTAFGIPGVNVLANRNQYLDHGISRELPELGESNVKYGALNEIEIVLNSASGAGLDGAMSKFFSSFSLLSGDPTDLNLRQQTLTSANALAREFQRVYEGIQRVQTSAEQNVKTGVDDVNALTAKIAEINGRIEAARRNHSDDEFSLRDERQLQLENLSTLMNISWFETESGSVTVTTEQGKALVLGNANYDLQIGPMAGGPFSGIMLGGENITSMVTSGTLGGYIELRDVMIPGYLETLDNMAAGIISRVNDVHAQGSDLDGAAGGAFFTPFIPITPGSNTGAARTMSVALTDPRGVAAAESGAEAGNNKNAKALAAISEEMIFPGSSLTASRMYASLVYRVGADERSAMDAFSLQKNAVDQLRNRRESMFGVDLNEEAVNVLKYQTAYQAGARMVSVLDSLTTEILRFVGV